ncbi:MAG: hypothetical protein ACRDVZ_17925 [Jiangellaceae bacterium]
MHDVRCDADSSARPEALVKVGDQTLTLPMVDAGATRLRGVWEQTCDTVALERALEVSLEPGWQRVNSTGGPEMHGVLTLHRSADSEPITVTDLRGSVLLAFEPADPYALPLTLEPDQRVALPVILTSNHRCDPHAIGGSQQTFRLSVVVQMGTSDEPLQPIISPDEGSEAGILQMVTDACGLG